MRLERTGVRLGDQTFGSIAGAGSIAGGIAGRCGERGDNGASSVNSTIGGSAMADGPATGGIGAADELLDFARSQSSGPAGAAGAGSLAVAGKRGSG